MVKALYNRIKGDKVIWMVAVLLAIVSAVAVYSSISTLAFRAHGNYFKFLFKHVALIGMGFGLMFFVHKINFKYFSRISQVLMWVAGIMLLLTLLFGTEVNSAKRWLTIPLTNLTFQTSDFAKIVLIVFVARLLNQKRTMLHSFKDGVLPILYPIIIICGLILPADFSTAAILGLICLVMMFIGGVPFRHMAKIGGMAIAGLGLMYLLGKAAPELLPRFETWSNRMEGFFDSRGSEASGNYQIERAQYAIYDGGLLPKGPGSGSSRNFLPHPYSDMIYAFIVQEYGSILGGFGLIFLFLVLFYRSVRLSFKSDSHFGGLMVIGLSFMLVIQAFINMAVAVDLFPTTGQPLPLVSMGGTSTLFTCLAIGMILSVSRKVFNPEDFEKKEGKNKINPDSSEYAVS